FPLAQGLRRRCREAGALFIVNDRVDLALAVEADGAHVGQDDLPVREARRLLPPPMILGVSTHNQDQARRARDDGADYIAVGIALAASLPFLPSLQGQFLYWDDVTNFLMNEGYRGLGWPQLRYMLTTTLLGHWIPLTWLTLGVNYALGGMNPWGYHLGNLLLHSANAVCLYFIARRLLASASGETPARVIESMPARVGAAFAALVFAVHPLRVESVAWITERRDVLSGLFFLLSILFYLRATDGGAFIRGRWRTASLLAFAAAFLSKSIVMTLPGVLLLLDVYPLRR